MWYLYLDESGDLGFDFVNKKPSHYFTVAVLALQTVKNNRALSKAVDTTIKRKLNPKGKRKRIAEELKGNLTNFKIKKYFYKRVRDIKFAIYAVTLSKLKVYQELAQEKQKVYNWMARQVFDKIPFEKANDRVYLIIDKSKGLKEIREFNSYIIDQLKERLNPSVPLDIYHQDSKEIKNLQAIDMFVWGIHRKYEIKDTVWFNIFEKEKVAADTLYLK